MATYSDIHVRWSRGLSLLATYQGGSWVSPLIYVRNNGEWVPTSKSIGYPEVTEPRILVRSGGLWVAETYDEWSISVCRTSPGTSTNEYTIPSTIFGLSVNKVVISSEFSSFIFSKQYGGGVAFTHALTKNGSNVYALTGKADDGFTCADDYWSFRTDFTVNITYFPGDTIGARVVVPDTIGADYGGTKIERLFMRWYFN